MARRIFLAMLGWVPAGLLWLAAYLTMLRIVEHTEEHGMSHYMAVFLVTMAVVGIFNLYLALIQMGTALFKILRNAWVARKAAP